MQRTPFPRSVADDQAPPARGAPPARPQRLARPSLGWAAAALACLALGCGKSKGKADPGPSCRQIVSYMMRMPELGSFDERAAVNECHAQNWNAEQRRCLYTAKDVEAMSKCVPPVKLQRPATKVPKVPDWHTPVHEPIRGNSEGPDPRPRPPVPESALREVAPPAPAAPAPAPPAK